MRKYKLKELRELVRLGVAEDYTNKPSEYIYTLRRLEKVGYSPIETTLNDINKIITAIQLFGKGCEYY